MSVPIALRFLQLARRHVDDVHAQLATRHRLPYSELAVLYCLGTSGESTAETIRSQTGGSIESVDKAVRAMLDQACIARRESPDRGHGPLLSLTARGRDVVDATLPSITAHEARMLAPLTQAERASLARIMRKLAPSELEDGS